MAEVNLTLGDPIEVKVSPAEGATNVSVASAPQNVVQVQAAIATNGLQGADGAGVPTDPPGAAGQSLVKKSAVANDTEWAYIDKLHINVRNKTGATIPAGSVVYASGLQGNDILIDLADASDESKMPAIGFTYEDIGDNNKGDVISAGVLVKNITVDDAGTADVGDTMYVSPATPGGITTVRPSDAAHKVQNVGIALKVTGNNNQVTKFKVSAIDRVNDVPNLEDGHFFLGGAPGRISEYQLPTGSPTNGQLLKANADGNLVFVNASDVTKNIGTVDLTTTNTTRNLDIIEDGHLNIRDAQNDPILYIDEATKRVGINTTTLDKDAALFVNGNVLFKNGSTIGVEGGQEFNIGKIGSAAASATVNVTADLSVSGNCTIDTNLKFGTGGNQLHANTNNTFEFGKNGSGSADYKFNSDVGTVTFDNTTDVELKNSGGLKIFNSSNSVSIQSPSLASSYTLTLPNSSGTDGYVLKTDGSGTTSWVDVTAVSDAILDADFSNEDSGLMKKTGAGAYAIAAADTDYQSVPSEGAFADGDKTKLDYITVGAAIDLGVAVLTTDTDISGADFVIDEDDMDADSATKVPTQQSVKAYVDSHVKTAIYSDASDNPQLADGVTAGEVRTLIGAIDDYTVTQSDVTAHQAALSIATTQLTGLSATGNVSGITLSQTNGAFTLGGSLNTIPVSGGGTGATNAAGARSALNVDVAGTDNSTDVTLANVASNYLSISGQVITAGTVPVALGGTGATDAAAARSNLGVDAAGTDNSTDVTLANTNYLSLSGQVLTGGTVPIGSGGTGATTASGARSALNVDVAGTDNSTDVTLSAVAGNYLTITDQEITSGTVPLTLGGTGATSAAGARTNLDLTDADIIGKFSAGTGITISGSGEIASTVSDTNTQNTTTLSFVESSNDILLRNTTGGAGSGTQDIKFNAGSNITLTHDDSNNITIAATSGGIDAVEDDTTPALGGDLNVNGYEITSNTNQNITIAAGTNGDVNIDGDPVNIKHAGSTKLNTTTTGVQITGNAVLVDDDEVQLGDTSDLRLFHDSDDGANGTSKIVGKQPLDISSSGDMEISSTTQLEVKHGADVQIKSVASGGVELYHDGTKKIETASDGVRVSGGVQVTDGYVTRFNGLETDANASLSSAGNHRGADILANFYSTASVDAGKLYNADGTNGWELADKDAENTSASLLAIATDDGDADTMITKGIVRVHDIAGTSPSKGKTVYVGDSGIPTVTRPSADGDIVRIIGYVYDATDNVIFFNPSPDFIEVA